jgi:lysophospholipase L1-like esterase
MNSLLGTLGLFALALAAVGAADAAPTTAAPPLLWSPATSLTLEGRGWTDTDSPYYRLPSRAKSIVRAPVWNLARNSAGMAVRFITDATEIHARWTLTSPELAMNHMAATGVSGIDLYVLRDGRWRFLAVGRPTAQENAVPVVSDIPEGKREYILYFPLYNGVTRLDIGVPAGRGLLPAAPRARQARPVVFYGTSITQGGCASRPGMAYPAIIGRALGIATVNLGFSGNGRSEPEVADLLAELDPAAFVIDPLANMTADTVEERIGYLLKALHARHPNTPVLLVEHPIFTGAFNMEKGRAASRSWNDALRKVYEASAPAWNGRLHYVKCDNLYGSDGEATVDGVHPTDVGFMRMAAVIGPAVDKALKGR